MMIVKKHFTHDRRLVLAVCDSELIGKRLAQDDIELDLGSAFYSGEPCPDEEVAVLMKAAYCINAVGKRSVQAAVELGLVENVLQVNSVPYAQVLFLKE